MSLFVRFDGRREQVKLRSTHAPMQSVLKDALSKFGADASKTYALKKRGQAVDLAMAFSHTGLSLNAEVDLVKVEKKRGTVRVAVSAGGGASFDEAVDANASLGTVARAWGAKLGFEVTSVRVLRDSFTLQALETATLQSLGYGPGTSVRLHLQLGDKDQGAGGERQEKTEIIVEESPTLTTTTTTATATATTSTPLETDPTTFSATAPMDLVKEEEEEDPSSSSIRSLSEAVRRVASSSSSSSEKDACARTLEKYLSAVLRSPRETRFRTIPLGNASFQTKVAGVDGGVDVLRAVGFRESQGIDGKDVLSLHAVREDLLRKALALLEAQVSPAPVERPSALEANRFDPYRTSRLDLTGGRVPPRAESDAERELRLLSRRRAEALARCPAVPNRDLRAVSSTTTLLSDFGGDAAAAAAAQSSSSSGSTGGDGHLLRAAVARQQKLARQRTDAPLTTAASRDLDALKKKPLYAAARLKVLLSGTNEAVAATFGVGESLEAVLDFLKREALVDSSAADDLRLFTSPPPTTLDATSTVGDLGFAPAAVVRLDSKEGPLALRPDLAADDHVDFYPKPILAAVVTQTTNNNPGPPGNNKRGRGDGRGGGGGATNTNATAKNTKSPAFAWLKTGK